MARALSHLHSLIRGSVGGLTYFSNQFHQICMRQRTAPVQPNTPYQTGIRTAFDHAESYWEAITQAWRDAWDDYAVTCVYPGPAGPYTVPGRQLFVGTLALAIYADAIKPAEFGIFLEAPVVSGWFNPGTIAAATYSGETQGIALSISIPEGREAVAVVDLSIAFNLTRTRYKGPWITTAKTIEATAPGHLHIDIDRPAGTLGKAIFTRTRSFTATLGIPASEPHALAFPAFLRHICEEAPINGNDKPAAAKKATAKKKPT